MRLIKFILLLLVFSIACKYNSLAQKQNNIWYFGNKAGLNFNTEPPTPLEGSMYAFEGCAAISDSTGGLLFYTNGESIWDRDHQLMPNGTGLFGNYTSTQETLIVPLPGSCSKYYVFSNESQTSDGGLYYSIVDMLLNDGFGDVIQSTKNTPLVDHTTEKLIAVLHENETDIWIITSLRSSNNFLVYSLTSSGLSNNPIISSIGSVNDAMCGCGYLRSSHDRTRLVSASPFTQCELFDFNSATGLITNAFSISSLFPENEFYGVEFSPNDSLLYLSSYTADGKSFVYQLNLDPGSLQITTLLTANVPFVDPNIGAIQSGPNGKIYISRQYQEYLDVIHYPNIPGLSCQYEKAGIALLPGTNCEHGLPNPVPYAFCPLLSLGRDKVFCTSDSLLLAIPIDSTETCIQNFKWFDGAQDIEKFITQPGIYWIEVNTLCDSYRDSIQIRMDSTHITVHVSICEGDDFDGYTSSGTIIDTVFSAAGCEQTRTLHLTVNSVSLVTINKRICSGESYDGYNQAGTYIDTLLNVLGCDSIRTLILNVEDCPPIIHYDLNACRSVMADGSHMDYSEFAPAFPIVLECAEVTADFLFRIPIQENKHSCTPGINISPAMCITSFNSCQYEAGHAASVIIQFTITPSPDSIVRLKQFDFYERSPVLYSWINGPTGLNNTPRFYGLRILKNGTEVFLKKDIMTNVNWTLQSFEFGENENFVIDGPTNFKIELLAYCPIGNSSDVSVWDLDELKLYGECLAPPNQSSFIDGIAMSNNNKVIVNASVYLSDNPDFTWLRTTTTNAEGYYMFDGLEKGKSYFMKVYKNDDVLNGVGAMDLIVLQKHLLGIESFNSLDQFIAADANHDGRVNALDLIEILKLLLGKFMDFPTNTSWRFGVLPQDFSGTDLSGFNEVKYIESLDADFLMVDFLGIKIGDLNGDTD